MSNHHNCKQYERSVCGSERKMSSIKDMMLSQVGDTASSGCSRVTVVGAAGQVGTAVAFAILAQGVSNDVVLIDAAHDKLKGEAMDLQHGTCFLNDASVTASCDYAASQCSSVIIIAAGVRQNPGESRLNLVQRNVDLFKQMIPQLVKYSPEAVLLVVSNPVDVLTWAAWKLSGFPKNRVVGSGCALDTARFKYFLSERLGVAPSSVHGYIIGEHGDTSVPVWSSVNVSGLRLRDVDETVGTHHDRERWNDAHRDVVKAAYKIIQLKGYTNWAVALACSHLCSAILKNTRQVHPVSTLACGFHGIKNEVFLSLPCSLTEEGIEYVVEQKLSCEERKALRKSAETLHDILKVIKF